MHSIRKYLQQTNTEQLLYYISFALIFIGEFINTTMFLELRAPLGCLSYVGCVIMLAKILIYQRKNQVHLLLLLITIGLFLLSGFLSNNYTTMFSLVMITVGACNVPFKNIAKEYFWIAFTLMVITIFCSLTGVIENLQYTFETARGIRNSFGIVYPTDFAAHILFITMAFIIAYEEKLNIVHSLAGILITAVIYYFCDTRVDCACMLLAWAGIPLIKILQKKKLPDILKKICGSICILSMPVASVLMIVLSAVYTGSSPFMSALNELINGRLAFANEGFERYSVTLFGQQVRLIGAGGSTVISPDYFFLDCSYIYCLLKYGIIVTLLLVIAYVFIGIRYKHNGIILWIIAITALNCMIAHHLPNVSYVFFTAAVFADIEANKSAVKSPGKISSDT